MAAGDALITNKIRGQGYYPKPNKEFKEKLKI